MGNDAVSSKTKSYYYVLKSANDKGEVKDIDKPQPLTQITTAGTTYSHIPSSVAEISKLPDDDTSIDIDEKFQDIDSIIGDSIPNSTFEHKCISSINLVLNKQIDVIKDLRQQLISLGKPNAKNAKNAAQIYLIFYHEVQAYKQHLKTQQSIEQSLNINNSIELINEDDSNNILTQFSSSYELFREFLPNINKQDTPKKIDSEIEKTSKLISTLKNDINNSMLNISVNSEYKHYIKSTLSQISRLENLTNPNNTDDNLSNLDILSIQIRYAIKLKEIKNNLSKIDNKKINIEIPKSYLVLKTLRNLKESINNQSDEYFSLNTNLKDKLLKDIQTSISFQKGKFSIRQNSFIPSLENPLQISQEITIPDSLFTNKDIKFIRNMENFSLPNNNLWQKFDSNTQKVDLQNTKINFHKQKGNYCGIASLKNYFQTSSFKNCIDILSKRYDSKTYNTLKTSLNNMMNRNDISPKIAVAISFIVNKLKDIKLEDGVFNQDSFNLTQEEFDQYKDIFKQLFNVDNAKDLTAKIINYVKPSYDILRSFSEDVEGSGIDLSKASEIFSRYSISSDGKVNSNEHIPVSRFLNTGKMHYSNSEYFILNSDMQAKIKDVLKNIHPNSSLEDEHLEEIKKIIGSNDENFVSKVKEYHQELNDQETEDLIKKNGVILSGHNGEGDYSHGHYICIQKHEGSDKYYVMNSLKDRPEEFNTYEDAFKQGLDELSSYKNKHIWVEDK